MEDRIGFRRASLASHFLPSLQIASNSVCPVAANTPTPSVYIHRLGGQSTSSAEAT